MRIAQQPGSNKKKMRGSFAFLLVLLLIIPLTVLRAEEPAGPAAVSTADIEVTAQSVLVNLAVSNLASVRSFNLTSPSRVVFDIEGAVLTLADTAVTSWENPIDGIANLTISQFSTEPPVVRVVAEVSNPALQSDRLTSPDSVKLAIFTGDSPLVDSPGPGAPPSSLIPTIEKFWHEATATGEDRFVIEFSFGVVLPQVRIESPTVLLLRFPGTDVLLPPTTPDNFVTSVGGILVERMRAERLMESGQRVTEIRLTVPDTNTISYTLGTFAEDSLEMIISGTAAPTVPPVAAPIEPPVIEPVQPTPIEGGEIMVLASSENVPVMPDTQIHITRVQFQSIDSETDRYFIYYEGGELEPHVQRFNYPTRVAVYFPDAAVVLPESAEGRFQAVVHGSVTDELKVFNRVIEDVGPESQFIFYFPGFEQENVGFSVDYVDTGLMHIDFYRTAVPIDIDSPVEVNSSIDAPEAVPEETMAPPVEVETPDVIETPEVIEAPAVVEETVVEEPVIEEPVVNEAPETVNPVVVETTPPEVAGATLPLISVSLGETNGDTISFRIEASEQMPMPEWIQYHYPERLGLRFPYADVQLLDAPAGVGSSYTHVPAIPLVRAIMKDRDDEQYTTITFTLQGVIEEYTGDISQAGNGYLVTFHYLPLPVQPVVAPIQEEITTPVEEVAPVPVEETAPVAVESPIVINEPEPVPQPVEEPVVEPVEATPVIYVTAGDVATDNTVTFRISSTASLPMPEWVEYHYPERLGLKFPFADVQLMGAAQGTISSYTHMDAVPLVRAILDDRDDEQNTTITWTLAGKIEEYSREISQEGSGYLVTFTYTPAPVVPEPVQAPQLVQEAPAPAVIEQPAEQPVIEQPVEEQVVEQSVEEPVVVQEPEIPAMETPLALPTIEVSGGEIVGNQITFHITTSEPMPVPEWIEYRYPDRLGLRFPLCDVKLMGEDDALTVNTGVELVPAVRAIIKDRADDQNTTITFTLAGSLDEFNGETNWNGSNIDVVFTYSPVLSVPEAAVQPETVQEIEVHAMPEGSAASEPQETEVEEQPAPAPVEEPQATNVEGPAEGPEAAEEEVKPEEQPIIYQAEESEPSGEATEAEPEGGAVGPVRLEQPAEPVEEQEELGAEVGSEGGGMVLLEPDRDENTLEIGGAIITGISIESTGTGDIIHLTSDIPLSGLEVIPANYPTKLVVKIPNSRPVFSNGDPERYDENVEGNVVTQFTANPTITYDTTFTTLTIYAHNTEDASMLDYQLQPERNGFAIAVFAKGNESPLAGMPPQGGQAVPEIGQPGAEGETLVLEGVPEPVPVRPLEGIENTPTEAVDAGQVEESEPKISMTLEDANIRDVLQMISEQANLNVSIHPSVQGTITISLTDVPLSDLLELLGDQLGFTYFIKSGVYIFGEARALQTMTKDLWQRWYMQLSYADPDQVRNLLTSMGMLSQQQISIYRGSAGGGAGGTNIASQIMVLQGEPRDLQRAYGIIASIDQPPMMVQVHFQILNTSLTDNKDFGFTWNAGTGTGTTNLLFSEQQSVNTDMGPFPQGFDRLRSNSAYTIGVVVNYLLEQGFAELMNSSTLTVANNQNGNLFVGETIPYRSTFQVSELGRVTQRVSTQSVGLTLAFRPHANPDGTVTMYLSPTNSNLLELTDIGPRTINQNFTTTVRVMNDEPFIIGGFISDEKRVNYDRFPFLSELPLLGNLFRNRQITDSKSELIFVITPHIVYPSRTPLMVWTAEDLAIPVTFTDRPY